MILFYQSGYKCRYFCQLKHKENTPERPSIVSTIDEIYQKLHLGKLYTFLGAFSEIITKTIYLTEPNASHSNSTYLVAVLQAQ